VRAVKIFGRLLILGSLSFGGSAAFADASSPFLTELPASQGASPDFVVYQTARLDPRESGIAGTLQILQDKRVIGEFRQAWGCTANPTMALGRDHPFSLALRAHPLQNGRIRLTDSKTHILAIDSFDEPLAKVDIVYLYGSRFPTYLVTVDYGICIGSYSGPVTTLMEVRNGKLIDIPIFLRSSVTDGWKIVARAGDRAKEIEVVQSYPKDENPTFARDTKFEIDYSTYRFVDGVWRKKSIKTVGEWEVDEGWPPRSAFP
jgi:hypothetical protein